MSDADEAPTPAEPVDTSVDIGPEEAEDSSDPFADLENDETSWDDESDDSEEEVEETEESESEEPEEESEEEPEEVEPVKKEAEPQEEAPEEQEEEDTPQDEPKADDKTQKQIAHEAFKRREAERKLREERDLREKENLDRYLDEAQDDEIELAKRQTEVQRHLIQKEKISLNADKLEVGIQRFAAESDVLKNADETVKEAIAEALDDFEAMYVVKDKDGNPIEVKADVYQYLTKKANSIKKLTGIGARQQTRQKANEKTRTVPRPSRTPKEPAKDPDLDAFDKAFYG